jgi:hypothetical protein
MPKADLSGGVTFPTPDPSSLADAVAEQMPQLNPALWMFERRANQSF